MLAESLLAQNAAPGPHWGTSLYPVSFAEERLTLHFNRFTQFSSTRAQHPSQEQQTIGFNIATLSVTRELLLEQDQRVTWTLEGGAGYSSDQPTEWLQNDYLHTLRGLQLVPVEDTREATEYVAAAALNYWLGTDEPRSGTMEPDDDEWRYQAAIGVGASTSTIYHDGFVQLAGSVFVPSLNARFSALDRFSWPNGSEAFVRVKDYNNLLQVGVAYVPNNYFLGGAGTFEEMIDAVFDADNLPPWRWPSALHTLIGRPEVGLYATWDSGFFVRPDGSAIDTTFLSIRFDWPTGMRMETWNDFANGTDFGPTYGLLLSWDLASIFGRAR